MHEMEPEAPVFREVQKPHPFWLWLVAILCVPLPVWAFIQQIVLDRPFGTNPGPDWLVILMVVVWSLGFPLFIASLRLTVEVRPDELFLRFRPLRTRRIAYADIVDCAARTYRPLREYGGWGIKWGGRKGWVYSLSGNRGVQLRFRDGKQLLIGSRRADELAEEIRSRRTGPPPS